MSETLRYIINEKGQQTDVIVPINYWKKIISETPLINKKALQKKDMQKYIGKIKISVDPLEYQNKVRNEWK